MSLPQFKNKKYSELTRPEKIAMIERVCMDSSEYIAMTMGRGSKESLFINHWKENTLKLDSPSVSSYMEHYFYSDSEALCALDEKGDLLPLRFNIFETLLFIHNAVTTSPVKSNLIDRLIAGESVESIINTGIDIIEVLKLPSFKRKLGRPVNPNSLAQKVKRGELTRYEAFQKKILSSEDSL